MMWLIVPAYIYIALLLMVAAIVITKMAAKIAMKPEWDAWANEELTQLWINMLYIILIIGLYSALSHLAVLYAQNTLLANVKPIPGTQVNAPTTMLFPKNTIMPSALQSSTKDLIGMNLNILRALLYNRVLPFFGELINIIHAIEIYSGFSVSMVGTPGLDVKTRLGLGLEVPLSALVLIRNAFPVFIISLEVQIFTLELIKLVAYDFLVPFGLLLRIFPFTRDAGDELLAVVLGFTIFMPLLYIVMFSAVNDILVNHYHQPSFFQPYYSPNTSILSKIRDLFHTLIFPFWDYSLGSFYFAFGYGIVNTIEEIGFLGAVTVMLPTFIFISTISLVKALQDVLEMK